MIATKRQGLRPGAASAVGVLALSIVLAGCSGGSTDTGPGSADGASTKVASIRVADYYTDEPNRSIVGGVLDKCAAAAGVKIEREGVPAQQLISKLLQQINTKTMPDIQMIEASGLSQIAVTGALSPLKDRGVSTTNVAKAVKQMGEYDGKIYGVAPTVSSVVLYYNKDMLAKKGIKPPQTWAELKAAAEALTVGDRYGVAFSAINDGQAPWQFLPLFWTAGAVETDLDSPEAVSALQLWVDLVAKGSASKSVVTWGNSDVGDQFLEGRAAMMINSGGQMAKLDAAKSVKYATAKIPAKEAGGEQVSILGGEVWTLPVTGDEARQSKSAEVLSCLASSDSQMSLGTQRRAIPADPTLEDAYLKKLPAMGAYFAQVQNARSRTALLGGEWPATEPLIWTAVQAAVTGQATPADALKTAAEGQSK